MTSTRPPHDNNDGDGKYTLICVMCRKPFQMGDLYIQVRSFGDPDVTVYYMHVQCPSEAAK